MRWMPLGFILIGITVYFIRIIDVSQTRLTVVPTNQTITIERAETIEEREVGLSGREIMGDNEGMLFIYDFQTRPSFWMKQMQFPIDIIWIDESKLVVGIESQVAPSTYPHSFMPESPIQYVLEVNSGQAEALGITDGTALRFN